MNGSAGCGIARQGLGECCAGWGGGGGAAGDGVRLEVRGQRFASLQRAQGWGGSGKIWGKCRLSTGSPQGFSVEATSPKSTPGPEQLPCSPSFAIDRRIPRDSNHKSRVFWANGNGLEKRRTERFSASCFRGAAHPGPRVRTTASRARDWQMTTACNPYT